MDKAEIKQIVDDEIKKYLAVSLDKEMKRILHTQGSASRDEMIKTIKDSFEGVFKVLWMKRDFWKSDIR